MKCQELTEEIIGVFYDVYNELGHGFLESVYEQAMLIALSDAGLHVDRQLPITVHFRGQVVGEFCADIVVNNQVIVEIKAACAIESAYEAQIMHYLRATDMEIGLLMNFGPNRSSNASYMTTNARTDATHRSHGLTRIR